MLLFTNDAVAAAVGNSTVATAAAATDVSAGAVCMNVIERKNDMRRWHH